MIVLLFAVVLMSLGWLLRGQLGGMEGAMIPGAFAVVAAVAAGGRRAWRTAFGAALFLSAAGFALSSHLGYGTLFTYLIHARDFFSEGRALLRLFLIGALWGGLGFSFLGFGLNEKGLSRLDAVVLGFFALLLYVPLGFMKMEILAIPLFAAGLTLLHLYNSFWKKSSIVACFAIPGVIAIGGALVFTAYLMHAGASGAWPWRDLVTGTASGAAIWAAVRLAGREELEPASSSDMRLQQAGWTVLLAFIPFFNFINAFRYWTRAQVLGESFPALILVAAALLALLMVFSAARAARAFSDSEEFHPVFFVSVFYSAATLAFLAVMKQVLVLGTGRWEAVHTLILVHIFLLAALLPAALYRKDGGS